MEIDRISSLPDSFIHEILSRLPLWDAVRTSILSTHWRYKWATLPRVVLDHKSFPDHFVNDPVIPNKLAGIIDHVLLLHIGPIHEFELSCRTPLRFHDIDRWILYLSRRSIEVFVFNNPNNDLYRIPSCMFSCQSLTRLELWQCILRPPPTFKGFVNLQSLILMNVEMSQHECQKLISTCPVLQKLFLLVYGSHAFNLIIDAPNLQVLEFCGNFTTLTLQNVIHLERIYIHSGRLENSIQLLNSLANLPNLRCLSIMGDVLESLCQGGFQTVLPKVFTNLHRICIHVNFHRVEEVLRALYFLQIAPHLQELETRAWLSINNEESNTSFWEAVDPNHSFPHLLRIVIRGIDGKRYEEDFMNYMLSASPVLESMTVLPSTVLRGYKCMDVKCKLGKKLLSFRRASHKARIFTL